MPVEMTRVRFEELVADALDLVPEQFATAMNNVVVLVEDHNEEDPSLLGLYFGIALTEREQSNYAGVLPDRISIYREPLLEMCDSEDEVVDEVAITVVHEIAHHFGINEDTLHALGWG
ncbi:metallopeptidase family protein [Saccharopolyspora gloriosae]|uniref:Putative Zn-dependent protease with MMP-like domain n=1 Tax=Saccharopolyspora gloriosae TaxID=455344 RepID=A0A840NR72_9PSEU|nr:metallopeptidase family protein [Saccharopolyspora gloriosae]MBB5072465.1 putative Zn-dependent protease with MMP-like domain [Saccharopolyspora gloriosae]